MISPPQAVVDAITSDTTTITRRVDIYESDATTLWMPDAPITSGSVSVDASRDDRRSGSFSFLNQDGALNNYPGGFWYDKVIRPYRGIEYSLNMNAFAALDEERPLVWFRFSHDDIPLVSNNGILDEVGEAVGAVSTLSIGAWNGDRNGAFNFNGGHVEVVQTASMDSNRAFSLNAWFRTSSTSEMVLYIASDYATTDNGILVLVNAGGVLNRISLNDGVNVFSANSVLVTDGAWHHLVITIGQSKTRITLDDVTLLSESSTAWPRPSRATEGAWIGDHPTLSREFIGDLDEFAIFNTELGRASISRLYSTGRGATVSVPLSWECQLGDFVIDDIGTKHFPHTVDITCRDLMKNLMTSKYRYATMYPGKIALEQLVRIIATQGGITKMILPITGVTIRKEFYWDRGVSRAEALHQLAVDYNYDIYFDSEGFLVMKETADPSLTPNIFTFATGTGGSIATFDKKTRDTRIYNVIVVTGESTETIPVSAIAENREPTSPTRIAVPGQPGGLSERVYQYTSGFITTVEQAQNVANKFLAIHALEEFEVNLGTLVLPWLEAGSIVDFIDPSPNPGDPQRYLLRSFTIPLSPGPMSLSAKRVTIVG